MQAEVCFAEGSSQDEAKLVAGIRAKVIRTNPDYTEAQVEQLVEEIYYQTKQVEEENKQAKTTEEVAPLDPPSE